MTRPTTHGSFIDELRELVASVSTDDADRRRCARDRSWPSLFKEQEGRATLPDAVVHATSDEEVAATLPVVQHVMQDAPFPAVLLSVPLQVDARAANNWDEAH